MINANLVLSASISGSNQALSIPGPVNLTGSEYGPGGKDQFDVSTLLAYGYQFYVTGSNLSGTMMLQQSNNMAGWVPALSQSVSAPGDYVLRITRNTMAFARLFWSGSAGSGSSVTVAVAGVE